LFISGLIALILKSVGDNQLAIAKEQLKSDSAARLESVKTENATRLEKIKNELKVEGDQRLAELINQGQSNVMYQMRSVAAVS